MATEWVITEATERIGLNPAGQGEVTFTVTNPGPVQDRTVFDVVVDGGADRSWFSVEEPQRAVPPGASVTYVLRVLVPNGTRAGSYTVQGRVYSADIAPEESSALSRRVTFDVAPSTPPPTKPWWLIPIGVAIVLVVGVVAFLALRDGDDNVVTISSGDDIIHGTFSFDFDAGVETQEGADVFWEQQSRTERFLVPVGGAQIANLGDETFDDVRLADLEGASYSADPVDGSDLNDQMPAGTVLAITTDSGNLAKVLIVERDVEDPDSISIQNIRVRWTTLSPE